MRLSHVGFVLRSYHARNEGWVPHSSRPFGLSGIINTQPGSLSLQQLLTQATIPHSTRIPQTRRDSINRRRNRTIHSI
jgi:hypothetical protein